MILNNFDSYLKKRISDYNINNVAICFWVPLYDNITTQGPTEIITRDAAAGNATDYKQIYTDLDILTITEKRESHNSFQYTLNNNGIFSNWAWIPHDKFTLNTFFNGFIASFHDDNSPIKFETKKYLEVLKDYITDLNDISILNMKIYNTETLFFILQVGLFHHTLKSKIISIKDLINDILPSAQTNYPTYNDTIQYIINNTFNYKDFMDNHFTGLIHTMSDKFNTTENIRIKLGRYLDDTLYIKKIQNTAGTIQTITTVKLDDISFYSYAVLSIGRILLDSRVSCRGEVYYFNQKQDKKTKVYTDTWEISWLRHPEKFQRVNRSRDRLYDPIKLGQGPLIEFLYYLKEYDFILGNDQFGKFEWHPMRSKIAKQYVTSSDWREAWSFIYTNVPYSLQSDLLYTIQLFKFAYNYSVDETPVYFSRVLYDMVAKNIDNNINPLFFEISPHDDIYAIKKNQDDFMNDIKNDNIQLDKHIMELNEINIRSWSILKYGYPNLDKNLLGEAIKKVYNIVKEQVIRGLSLEDLDRR